MVGWAAVMKTPPIQAAVGALQQLERPHARAMQIRSNQAPIDLADIEVVASSGINCT